jgi:hypothetical protein
VFKLPVLTVAYMILILSVSSIPANDASLPGSIMMGISASVQSVLHIPEYALLFCLCSFTLLNLGLVARRAGVAALLFCLAFAAVDECYQYFIPGRFTSFSDWLYDAVGALVGYAVVEYCLAITFIIEAWELSE